MKKAHFTFYILHFTFYILHSQNLVLNPGFETISSCPTNSAQLYKAYDWFRATAGDPELYHSCATGTLVHTPNASMGYQIPKTGIAYSGLYLKFGNGNFREYIETKLSSPLQPGKKYCAEMYLSLSDSCWEAVSNVGMYFSKDSVIKDTINFTGALTTITPQINNAPNNYLTDKKNWTVVKGTFIAIGGEKLMTIGNFSDNTNTPFVNVGAGIWALSYYYIDDVSVIELPEATELSGGNKVICSGDSVMLGIAQKQNISYTWQGSGIVGSGSSSWAWVKPGTTTTYTLTVSDTSVVCADSSTSYITVSVNNCDSLNQGSIKAPNVFSPNGDGVNDAFRPQVKNISTLNCKIYNRWGLKVYEYIGWEGFWDGRTSAGSEAPAGTYYFIITAKDKEGKEIEEKGFVSLIR